MKQLTRVGVNRFGNTAYSDGHGNYYISCGMGNSKELYTVSPQNDMDGDPDFPLKEEFEILNPYTERELRMINYRFEYFMLSRLMSESTAFFGKTGVEEEDKVDCRYHNIRNIWGTSIEEHNAEMRRLWKAIPEDLKPEWCSLEDIDHFEAKTAKLCITT